MCMSVDLPGARRPHDRGQLALADLERDAPERVHRGVAFAVQARDVVRDDDAAPAFRSPSASLAVSVSLACQVGR